MRLVAPALLAATLAGCSDGQREANTFDIANAASSAQSSIDNYAAISRKAATPARRAAEAPAPAPIPAAPPGESLSEAPFTPESAQGAANVVQHYYALLESGRYRQAWRLWDDDGRASGMSAKAFAASFAPYSEHHAEIGPPGRIDAGAGQRHVTVPVKVYGTLKDSGRAFSRQGSVTLHRVADIEGATAAERSWRISASDVGPPWASAARSPTPAAGTPDVVSAHYRCADGARFVVRFDNQADTATVTIGGERATLSGQRPASGIWYRGGGYELRGKGAKADFSRPGKPTTTCIAR